MRRVLALFAVAATLAACQDSPLTSPERAITSSSVQTANSSWLDHFFFLPPLGPGVTPTADFNPDAPLAIRIVHCADGPDCTVANDVALFTTTGAPGTGLISVSASAEQYSTQWSTSSSLDDGMYRVRAVSSLLSGAMLYGYVDLQVYAQANDANDAVAENGGIAVNKGSNVPLKMRIEDGLFCGGAEDCTEGSFTNDGDGEPTLIYSTDNYAVLEIPDGFTDPDVTYVVTITRFTGPDPCLPTNHPQSEGCYEFHVEPSLADTRQFEESLYTVARVGICLEGTAELDESQLWKWDQQTPVVFGDNLERLPFRDVADILSCTGFTPSGTPRVGSLGMSNGMDRWLKPLARLFGHGQAYAAAMGGGTPTPGGGDIIDFSRIGWVRELTITKVSGDNQTGITGEPLNLAPTVEVASFRKPSVKIPGVKVTWDVLTGGGSIVPVSSVTNAAGLASTAWTLGGTLGAQTLKASAWNPCATLAAPLAATLCPAAVFPNIPETNTGASFAPFTYAPWGSTIFTANSVAPPAFDAFFLSPLGSASGSKSNQSQLTPTVDVCHVSGTTCDQLLVIITDFQLSSNKQSFQVNWATPGDGTLVAGQFYRIRVLLNNVELGSVQVKAVASGTKTREPFTFEIGRTLPIKFVILPAS